MIHQFLITSKTFLLQVLCLLIFNTTDIKLTEILRFDGDNEALYGIADLIPLDDGSFVISDRLMNRILKVNGEGELVKMTGRDGRGPGEFSGGPDLIVENDGLLYVFDRSISRVVQVFDHDLNYVTTLKIRIARDAVAISDSVMLLHYYNSSNDKFLHLYDYFGEPKSSLDHETGSNEYTNLNNGHILNIGKERMVLVYKHMNRIEFFNPEFELSKRVSIDSLPEQSPLYQRPGTDQIVRRFEGRQREIVEKASYWPEITIFQSAASDGKGNVYIQLHSDVWDLENNIIVLNDEGIQIDSFMLPDNQELMAIGDDDRLYSKSTSDDMVFVYQIDR